MSLDGRASTRKQEDHDARVVASSVSMRTLSLIAALALGALKARYSLKGPLRNGLEFLAVVTAGTIAGAGIGLALHAA